MISFPINVNGNRRLFLYNFEEWNLSKYINGWLDWYVNLSTRFTNDSNSIYVKNNLCYNSYILYEFFNNFHTYKCILEYKKKRL